MVQVQEFSNKNLQKNINIALKNLVTESFPREGWNTLANKAVRTTKEGRTPSAMVIIDVFKYAR